MPSPIPTAGRPPKPKPPARVMITVTPHWRNVNGDFFQGTPQSWLSPLDTNGEPVFLGHIFADRHLAASGPMHLGDGFLDGSVSLQTTIRPVRDDALGPDVADE